MTSILCSSHLSGGEGGIRTLDRGYLYSSLGRGSPPSGARCPSGASAAGTRPRAGRLPETWRTERRSRRDRFRTSDGFRDPSGEARALSRQSQRIGPQPESGFPWREPACVRAPDLGSANDPVRVSPSCLHHRSCGRCRLFRFSSRPEATTPVYRPRGVKANCRRVSRSTHTRNRDQLPRGRRTAPRPRSGCREHAAPSV